MRSLVQLLRNRMSSNPMNLSQPKTYRGKSLLVTLAVAVRQLLGWLGTPTTALDILRQPRPRLGIKSLARSDRRNRRTKVASQPTSQTSVYAAGHVLLRAQGRHGLLHTHLFAMSAAK